MKKETVMFCGGAYGVQGAAVIAQLLQGGYGVRAVARSDEKCRQLVARGIDALPGDLADLESLVSACNGADYVVFLPPLEGDKDKLRLYTNNVLEMARSENIGHMVYKSQRHPGVDTGVASFELKRSLEAQIMDSGIPCVCLRPTVYMENFAAPWSREDVNERSALNYPIRADRQVAWNSMEDVVCYIVAALQNNGLAGGVFDIGGPAVSGNEIASQFSAALGRHIKYEYIPREEFAAGISPYIGAGAADGVKDYYSVVAAHPDTWRTVSRDIGMLNHEPRDNFESWVRRHKPAVFS